MECGVRPLAMFSLILLVLHLVLPSFAVKCYICGHYTEGVGSITPCYEFTEKDHLKECKSGEDGCIKYVSKGWVVRGCEKHCKEMSSGDTETFCCHEDGCNSAALMRMSPVLAAVFIIGILWRMM